MKFGIPTTLRFDTPVKHLLVDLDGTLLGNRNLPLSFDFVRRSMAALLPYGGWRKAARALIAANRALRNHSVDITNDNRVVTDFANRLGLAPEEGRKVIRDGLFKIFPQLERHFFPVPGSKEFLEWAKDRYPLTLTTNPVWPQEIIEMRVKWAGIDPTIFKSITHVHRMHSCKPTREFYREVLEQEGVKAEDCILIGDDEKMDLPATRAGIRVFIVGKNRTTVPLKAPGSDVPAWRGNYRDLQDALEASAAL